MKNLLLNIFCSMTLIKKIINYGDISKKLILETFTFPSLFSSSSTSRGKISNVLFHCRTQCFFFAEREGNQRSPKNSFRVFLKL